MVSPPKVQGGFLPKKEIFSWVMGGQTFLGKSVRVGYSTWKEQ